ncbi:MAG: hypothetical protein Q4G30_02885 [Actinomycetaceae bacterium]|nr:hypothetical protein [Actinomycetaceae bacterium]
MTKTRTKPRTQTQEEMCALDEETSRPKRFHALIENTRQVCEALGQNTDPKDYLYGPRAWTLDTGVMETVLPFTFWKRLGTQGLEAFEAGAHISDYTPFVGLGAQAAQRLLEILPEGAHKDTQNFGPQLGELLSIVAAHPGTVGVSGYIIGPQRVDERLSVETLIVIGYPEVLAQSGDENPGVVDAMAWMEIKTGLGIVTEVSMPDEIWVAPCPWDPESLAWHLWWD